jgi:hypothetical protein
MKVTDILEIYGGSFELLKVNQSKTGMISDGLLKITEYTNTYYSCSYNFIFLMSRINSLFNIEKLNY